MLHVPLISSVWETFGDLAVPGVTLENDEIKVLVVSSTIVMTYGVL